RASDNRCTCTATPPGLRPGLGSSPWYIATRMRRTPAKASGRTYYPVVLADAGAKESSSVRRDDPLDQPVDLLGHARPAQLLRAGARRRAEPRPALWVE